MILVTGASGHVGNVLVRQLAERNEPLRLFMQPNETVVSLDGINCEIAVGDIRDAAAVDRAVKGCNKVFHLAGIIDISSGHDDLLRTVNVEGTRNIVNSCLANGVDRLVYVSTIHAIPEPPHGVTIKEAERRAFPSQDLLGPYAKSKSAATDVVYKGIEQGLDAVIVFPTGIIGPGDYRGSYFGNFLSYLLKNSRRRSLPCFKGAYDFVDVRDVSDALIKAMNHGESGQGYILSGHRITLTEMFREVSQIVNRRKVRLVIFPLWLVKFGAFVITFFARLFRRRPFYTMYSIQVLESNSEVDNSKARAKLGYSPRPMDITLRETIEFLKGIHADNRAKRRERRRAKAQARAAKCRRARARIAAFFKRLRGGKTSTMAL
ncbi:MAG: NAD-dependent epimerase/dehydratase family protein [Clostridiaceae bacterium]|nr:NAD-dependent epimerase/dehydratase family protein [Clostridiaceae bacterium]